LSTSPASNLPPWEKAWLKSRTNPLLFVTDVLQATPEPWQIEALKLVGLHDRVSIRAGHGVGKTTFLAWVVLWFMLTRMPFKIPITANSQDQLRDVVWPELRKWHGRLPEPLKAEIEIAAERLFLKGAPECFAVARTASKDNPEALQGFHEDNLLFVVEEASGIDDIVFEVGAGALSTAGAKLLMLANPTRTSGYFYDSHHALRARFKTMRVNSEDVPRARGHIDDIIAKYGRESNAYRVRVLGDFPTTEDDAVIPLHLCESAVVRQVRATEFRPVWGLDVARFGDDRTALCKRQGNTILEPVKSWRQKDTMQVAGIVMEEYRLVRDTAPDLVPAEILVDVIGLGAGVVDRLFELGLPVRGVNVGESASVSDRFMRRRDELWFAARDWLAAANCKLADDDELIAELTAPKYTLTSSGKVLVEPKDEMKKRGLSSPDLADAFILTFAGGLDKKPDEQIDRYRRRLYGSRKGSWMTA
jgi:phage terminase large subunit